MGEREWTPMGEREWTLMGEREWTPMGEREWTLMDACSDLNSRIISVLNFEFGFND
jgi:hypothetical protein